MKKIMIGGVETTANEYDDYGKALAELGAEGFLSLDPSALAAADGLLLPGSSQDMNPKLWGEKDICSNDINDELDRIQWNLLELAMKQGKPVLGICRGMQFINVYFGGTLIQELPCAAEHKERNPEQYHPLMHLPGSCMAELFGETSEVNTRHHQGVGLIGDSLEAVSLWNDGEDCVVEALWQKDCRMLGVQWHPEGMYLHGDENQRRDGEKLLRWWLELV